MLLQYNIIQFNVPNNILLVYIKQTYTGIGPTYAGKMLRTNLRVSDVIGDKEVFQTKLAAIIRDYQLRFPNHSFDDEIERFDMFRDRLEPMVKVRSLI